MALVRRGGRWCVRYYGPDGWQRWETIGPNKKEAESVLAQRLYEVRSGKYPILRRRTRIIFREHAEEWMESYARPRVRASTLSTYRWLLDYHLFPAFGERALVTLTSKDIQRHLALKAQQVSPKTVNHTLFLLKGVLDAAVEWDRLPSNPAHGVRPIAAPRREMRVWTIAEIRHFLLTADDRWRPLFVVALFTGLRVGELQAMAWDGQNRPNFTTNKLEVSCAWSHRAKRLGPRSLPGAFGPSTWSPASAARFRPSARAHTARWCSRGGGAGCSRSRTSQRRSTRLSRPPAWRGSASTTAAMSSRPS